MVAFTNDDDGTVKPFLELYSREVHVQTEDWPLVQACPNQTDNYCFQEVDIVSMAIHLLDDATVDVYYVERGDMVGGATE